MGREVTGGGYRHESLRFGFGTPVYVADVNFDRGVFPLDAGNESKVEDILRRYGRAVRLEFEQDSCNFSLESLSPDFPLAQIVEAFQLVSLDDYHRQYAQNVERRRPGV